MAYNRNGKRNTYGYSRLLVVLRAGISNMAFSKSNEVVLYVTEK